MQYLIEHISELIKDSEWASAGKKSPNVAFQAAVYTAHHWDKYIRESICTI